MREKNRKPIASYIKLPQFTTMNVIDGQAGLIIYASLIFYSLTIDNILNIIVLLILAGVTIATLTGDNGLLTKASNAKNTSTEAEIMEKIKLAYQDYYLGQHTQSGYTFQNAVDKTFGDGVVETVTESNGVYTLKFTNGKTYEYNTSTGTSREKDTSLGGQVTKDNYGDYIDLGQSVIGTSATSDDWRILYNDKNGHIYAILADYLPNNIKATPTDEKTIVANAGLSVWSSYYVYTFNDRATLLAGLNHESAWQGLIPSELRNSCQVRGSTTCEILMASYNEKYGTSLNYTDYPYLYIDAESTKGIDTLYMPHPGSSNVCQGYWLCTPVDGYEHEYVWFVAYDGKVSFLNYNFTNNVVRPVVSIPSNTKVTSTTSNETTIWTVIQ